MMKNLLTIALALVTTISFAQNFVSTTPENKNVVLEEYTGIYCVWCPAGHVIGAQMHAANPSDVFLINVHTGGFATPNSPSDPNFSSDFGNQLANSANVTGYPTGSVNRRVFPVNPGGTAMSRSDWNASAQTVLAEPSPVNIGALASFDMSTGILTVDVETYFTQSVTNTNGVFLHIAVVQNNMPGPQTGAVANGDPASIISGPWNPTYNHQHVLRHFMTGATGLEYNVTTAGTFVPQQLTWNIPTPFTISNSSSGYVPDIDPTNLAVIAYIDEGGSNVLTGTEATVVPVFPNAYDANVTASSAPDVMCATETDIEITFRNFGNQPLTSLDLTYDINGGSPATYNWTGNLASAGQETVTITNVSFNPLADSFSNPGNTVTWTASNPNGQIDQNTTNNSSVSKFSHAQVSGDVMTGISAGFINISLVTDDYGSETSWEIVEEDGTIVGSGGNGGAYQSNSAYSDQVIVNGNTCYKFILKDDFGDGMFVLQNGPGSAGLPMVLVTDSDGTVIFEGDAQNLQTNFTELDSDFSTGASTGPGWVCSPFGCIDNGAGNGTYMSQSICESDPAVGCFVGPAWSCGPTGCYDVGTAGLGDYNTEQECIDDATSAPCNGTVSINENSANKFNLYPNPARDILNIEGNFKSIEIYDVFGKLVLASDNKSEVNISSLANGSYYLNILTQDAVIKRKVTVTK